MQILILTSLIVFCVLSILFLALYLNMKKKYSETSQKLQESSDKYKNLNLKIDQIKDELSTKRIGYYIGTTNLMSKEDKKEGKPGDPYKYVFYIKEIDRYTNGMSKIQLTNIEITSGFSPDQFDWIKKCAKNQFSSIKKTSEIEWLESEENVKEQRRQKLEKILNDK